MKFLASILLAILSTGCPQSAEGPSSGSTDDAGRADVTSPKGDTFAPELDLTITSVERQLFSGNLVETQLDVTREADGFRAEVGPGVWGIQLLSGGEVVFGPDEATEVGFASGPQSGLFFNPETTTVFFSVSGGDGDWQITATPMRSAVEPAIDARESARIGTWFDEVSLQFDRSSDPGGTTVELLGQQRVRGGPRETTHGVLFMVAAQDGEPAPQIRGTWNDFSEDPSSILRRVRQGLWVRYIEVPPGRQEYKVYYPGGDAWVTDLGNPHIVWDGFDPGTVGDFNSVIRPSGARTVWLPGVESPELGNARDVYVHLPAAYDGGGEFPALYVHDGNESIVRGQFHSVADDLAPSNADTSSVLVFVALPSQDVRLQEYTMGTDGAKGDAYVTFLADTLVPSIESSFRVRAERNSRGLAGASLGGLISFWGAMERPETFGYSAGMSSSFFWGEDFVIRQMETRGCQDVGYYLDSGSPDDNYDVTLVMRDVLDGLGCTSHYVLEQGGQHDWSFWNRRFGGVLEQFAATHGGR